MLSDLKHTRPLSSGAAYAAAHPTWSPALPRSPHRTALFAHLTASCCSAAAAAARLTVCHSKSGGGSLAPPRRLVTTLPRILD
jgi:hypothetical protein